MWHVWEDEQVPAPETVFFEGPEAFEVWLEEYGATSDEVWIRMAKKQTGIASLDWAGAVEVALCFGWIDGQSKRIDGEWFAQRFTPRRRQSTWSKLNRQKVEALIAAGRMRPAGLAEVARAKADGRWDAAYDSQRNATVPGDLQAALDANPAARDFFATLNGANRYAVLFRVQTAKKPETRARRIETLVAMLARNEKIHG